jgi:hypothetical protein
VKLPFAHCNIYAVQCIGDNLIILHDAAEDNVPTLEALIGQNVDITNNNERIGSIMDTLGRFKQQERNKGWSRQKSAMLERTRNYLYNAQETRRDTSVIYDKAPHGM